MKKKVLFLIMITIILTLTGCGNKKALNSDGFSSELGKEGFSVTDVTYSMEDKNVEFVGVANNGNYQIEYHIYKSEESAKKAYEGNKKAFKNYKKKDSKEKENSGANYDKYTLELSDEYKVVSRNENTLVYASINLEYKKNLNNVLNKIGY